MYTVMSSKKILSFSDRMEESSVKVDNLAKAQINREYTIKEVRTDDEELKSFLFTLGCFKGETVTILSILGENYVISVKDARYSINKDLAETIII